HWRSDSAAIVVAVRLNALGAYGYFFTIYYCAIQLRINAPVPAQLLDMRLP
ncbi:MAG: hypothetical protein QOI90_4237, partial [Mycobacterium sp.]|nr:hypothetical protein [Mycobacterium sp.]